MREFRWSYVNPYCILRDLLINLWVILLCVAIAWMGSQIVLENLHKPEYTSTATYFIAPKDSTNSAYSNISSGYQIAGVLSTVFESQILAQKTAEAMGLRYLPAKLNTSVVEYTNLLRLQVVAATPELAFRTIVAIMENHPKVSDYVVNNAVAEVLEPPTVPSSPSNYIPLRATQRTASIVATLLATAILVVLSVLRDTVKTEDALRQSIDAQIYGTVRHEVKNKTIKSKLQHLNKVVLISNPVTSFSFNESIKRICTKLEYAATLRGHKTFLISSASENEGKSTLAANLAIGLSMRGFRVLLVDGDLKRPSQYKVLDRDSSTVQDFADYLREKASFEHVLQHDEQTGLHLLINRHSYRNSSELLSSPQMKEMMQRISRMMDFVIVDSAPITLTADTEVLASLCDTALLVVRQDHSFVQTINDAVDKLAENTELLGCVFNRERTLHTISGSYERKYGHYYKKIRHNTKVSGKEQKQGDFDRMGLEENKPPNVALYSEKILQDANVRQQMMMYSVQHGVSKASMQYECSKKTVHKWLNRWDGNVSSLEEQSQRPKSSPRKQSKSEKKLVKRYAQKYPKDYLLGYQIAGQHGYKRSFGCYKRTSLKLLGKAKGKPKKQKKPKP